MKISLASIILILLNLIHFLSLCYAQDYMQWDLPEGAKNRVGKGNIVGVKFTSDGNRLIVDTAIGLWIYDIHTGVEIDFIQENRSYNFRLGSSLGVSQNDEMYVTIDNESTFTVRNLRDSSPIYKFHEQTDNIRQVVFSPEGNILAVCNNNLINLWDLNTGIKKQTLLGHIGWIREIAFSPNGLTLACVDSEKVLQLWDVDTGKPIKIMSKYIYRVDGLAFTSDGENLLLSSQGFLQSWNVSTGLRNYNIHADSVHGIAFSPNGNTIATIGGKGLYLWKGTSGEFITELGDYDWGNNSIAFSPDGNTLVCGGTDGLTLWDTISWEPKLSIAGHNIFMKEIDLHPNRSIMASISLKRIHFWDTTTWHLENELQIERFSQLWDLDFNPDGTTLATIVHGEILVWEISSGAPLAVLNSVYNDNWTGGVGFTSVEFSSDGNILAAGNYNTTIQLWYKGRTRKGTLKGHKSGVNSIAFHPNNRLLVSGSYDNTVKLWNVDTESQIFTLIGHSDVVNSVTFNPDGTYIASGSADKSIILWDIDTGDYNKTFISIIWH